MENSDMTFKNILENTNIFKEIEEKFKIQI